MEVLEKILKQIKEDNIVCPSPNDWYFFYKGQYQKVLE
tara:strand:- start:14 stop:127 length:114 start_codon:yes stop_codon:yes gene_type:complete